jgi:hypothetical protein
MKADFPAPAADIGAVAVKDAEGRDRKLAEAWASRTAIVAFIRHFA